MAPPNRRRKKGRLRRKTSAYPERHNDYDRGGGDVRDELTMGYLGGLGNLAKYEAIRIIKRNSICR